MYGADIRGNERENNRKIMKNYIRNNKEHVFFFALGVVVFGLTFTAFSVDASTFVVNQPPSCMISLKDVPTGYPVVSAPQGSGYPMLLSWGSSNATAASISPSIGSVPVEGSRVVYVRGERFSMSVYGPRGNATCQTTEYMLPSPYFAGSIVAGPIMSSSYLSSMYAPTYAQYTNYPTLATTPKPIYTYPNFQAVSGHNVVQPVVARHISLTQIPYTGVGDMATALLAWFSVIAVAMIGAVVLAQRGQFFEKMAARIRG